MLKNDKGTDAEKVVNWVETGVHEALERKYLATMSFGVSSNPEQSPFFCLCITKLTLLSSEASWCVGKLTSLLRAAACSQHPGGVRLRLHIQRQHRDHDRQQGRQRGSDTVSAFPGAPLPSCCLCQASAFAWPSRVLPGDMQLCVHALANIAGMHAWQSDIKTVKVSIIKLMRTLIQVCASLCHTLHALITTSHGHPRKAACSV